MAESSSASLQQRLPADQLEAWRRLAMQLRLDLQPDTPGSPGQPSVSLLIVSPTSLDVSAPATLQLAHFLAEEQARKVLVVDACFGTRELSLAFGQGEAPGLLQLLDASAPALAPLTHATEHRAVAFLPAGRAERGLSGVLQPAALRRVLAEAGRTFDFVILHASPVLEDASTLAFPSVTDNVLLLVAEGQTRLDDLQAAQRALTAAQAKRVGLVLTKPVGGAHGWASRLRRALLRR
ncbi:MAG: hypothetical protein ACT4PU_05940 [Planctomycetota bacterium]